MIPWDGSPHRWFGARHEPCPGRRRGQAPGRPLYEGGVLPGLLAAAPGGGGGTGIPLAVHQDRFSALKRSGRGAKAAQETAWVHLQPASPAMIIDQ